MKPHGTNISQAITRYLHCGPVGEQQPDGMFDWFVGGIHDERPVDRLTPFGVSGNRLYHNDGNRTFSDWTDRVGVRKSSWSWGAAFLDYDNDGV